MATTFSLNTPTHALPRDAYVSPEIYAEEIEKIWSREWVYVGHVSRLENAGDFFTVPIGPHRLIVVRGEDGKTYALHNVCRHRGSVICRETTGHRHRSFVCPFHGWAYSLDGSLRAAPCMPDEVLDKPRLGLKQAHVDSWNGFLFVCVAPDRPDPVAIQFDSADFSRYNLEHTRIAWSHTYELKANWKVAWEGGVECYHCAINHPELVKLLEMETYTSDQRAGPALNVEFTQNYPLRNTARTLTLNGALASLPLGPAGQLDPPTGVAFLQRHLPPWELTATPDYATVTLLNPVSPGRTDLELTIQVHEDAVEGKDYELDELVGLARIVREQDNDLAEAVQAGIDQPSFEPGPLNPTFELLNRKFIATYIEAIGDRFGLTD